MTRNQLIYIVGKEAVEYLESMPAECDNVPITNGQERWSAILFFKESKYFLDKEIHGIKAIYYVDPELTTTREDADGDILPPDLSLIDWEIEQYELIYA